jgi:hypothetical protein
MLTVAPGSLPKILAALSMAGGGDGWPEILVATSVLGTLRACVLTKSVLHTPYSVPTVGISPLQALHRATLLAAEVNLAALYRSIEMRRDRKWQSPLLAARSHRVHRRISLVTRKCDSV